MNWRAAYCRAAKLLRIPKLVVRANGAFFVVDRRDNIGNAIAERGTWEPDLLAHLTAIARHHSLSYFIDIGANIGFYSVLFAHHHLANEVFAIEPLPQNYRDLMRNARINGLKNLTALNCALGDTTETVHIYEGVGWDRSNGALDAAKGGTAYAVAQVQLDDQLRLSSESILIKMDVEGGELAALRGMRRILTENSCYLQVESFPEQAQNPTCLLQSLGYVLAGRSS